MSKEMSRSLSVYYAELAKIPLLEDADVEFGLILRWKQNKDAVARDNLIRGNLRFVVKEAMKFATNVEQLQEYIGEGNVGLLEALKRYDANRVPRMRFLTYACWWVREKIFTAYYGEPIAHVPAHRQKAQKRKDKERTAEALHSEKPEYPVGHQEAHRVSLDSIIDAPNEIDPSKNHLDADDNHMHGRLRKEIATLPPREQTILNLYYGMKGEPCTDPQIARFLSLSPERARQLRSDAMETLRERLEGPTTSCRAASGTR